MNILLLSTIYPVPGPHNHGTKVCHFFAQDWKRMGHNVKVIHYQAVYPRPFYWVAKMMRSYLAAKTGAVIYTQRDSKTQRYIMDGIDVTKIPLFKPIPHGKFSGASVTKSLGEIIDSNNSENFVPDVIVAHFTNPMIEVLSRLKKQYPNAKTCDIVHGDIDITINVYGSKLDDYLKDIDVWGFRCKAYLNEFKEKISTNIKSFICYSGIPDSYITQNNSHTYRAGLKRFLFVGELIERKYPSQIIDALEKVYPQDDYKMIYVGEGQQKDVIEQKVKELQIEPKVSLLGKIPRDEIRKHYDDADCMIMISRGEAYGLVYLEAMARGCITIASRNEGFDGIIKDGENGFLCKAGDADELAAIINRINAMTSEERMTISENAIATAKWLTDANAAKMYIDDVVNA